MTSKDRSIEYYKLFGEQAPKVITELIKVIDDIKLISHWERARLDIEILIHNKDKVTCKKHRWIQWTAWYGKYHECHNCKIQKNLKNHD